MIKEELLQELLIEGVLHTPGIIEAFRVIDRADFVPEDFKDQAYVNAPLPIGEGQTISQPLTVAFMLELLQPQFGHNILDIGSGSGWQTALLAQIVGDQGYVTALEIIPELYEQSIKNITKYNFISKGTVEVHNMSGENGYPTNAPYDCIIAAASLSKAIPSAWKEQLKTGGIIVTPVRGSIIKITKLPDGTFSEEEFPGFAFVPFV